MTVWTLMLVFCEIWVFTHLISMTGGYIKPLDHCLLCGKSNWPFSALMAINVEWSMVKFYHLDSKINLGQVYWFDGMVIYDKYWNWCRCIQRKDSAGVILTASWFNDINIGYRFHISTVCHSCCNNVMYFSKENLDISGSAWKKYHAGMAFLLARIVLVLKLYIQGESCVRPIQASAARLRPGSGILFMTYIDICII